MLAEPCPKTPASQYGIDNLKSFSEGKLPVYKSRSSDPDFVLERKAVEEPVSDFGKSFCKIFFQLQNLRSETLLSIYFAVPLMLRL